MSHLRRGFFLIGLMVAIDSRFAKQSFGVPLTEPDAAELMIAQNEAAFNKVKDIAYDFRLEYKRHFPIEVTTERIGHMVESYPSRRVEYTYTSKFGDEPRFSEKVRAAFDPHYLSYWYVGNGLAYQFGHESVGRLGDTENTHYLSTMDIDYLVSSSFGHHNEILRALVGNAERLLVERNLDSSEPAVLLTAFRKSGDSDPLYVLTFSPAKDFLLTDFVEYNGKHKYSVTHVELQQTSKEKHWFPLHTHIVESYILPDGKSVTGAEMDVQFSNVSELDPRESGFDISSLHLPEGQEIISTGSDGKLTRMFWKSGVAVPVALENIGEKVEAEVSAARRRSSAKPPPTTVPALLPYAKTDNPTIGTAESHYVAFMIIALGIICIGGGLLYLIVGKKSHEQS